MTSDDLRAIKKARNSNTAEAGDVFEKLLREVIHDSENREVTESFDGAHVTHIAADDDLLARWNAGYLSPAELATVYSHLSQCPKCFRFVCDLVKCNALQVVLPDAADSESLESSTTPDPSESSRILLPSPPPSAPPGGSTSVGPSQQHDATPDIAPVPVRHQRSWRLLMLGLITISASGMLIFLAQPPSPPQWSVAVVLAEQKLSEGKPDEALAIVNDIAASIGVDRPSAPAEWRGRYRRVYAESAERVALRISDELDESEFTKSLSENQTTKAKRADIISIYTVAKSLGIETPRLTAAYLGANFSDPVFLDAPAYSWSSIVALVTATDESQIPVHDLSEQNADNAKIEDKLLGWREAVRQFASTASDDVVMRLNSANEQVENNKTSQNRDADIRLLRLIYGTFLLRARKPSTALEQFNVLLEHDAKNTDAAMGAGIAKFLLGEYEAALSLFEQRISELPQDVDAPEIAAITCQRLDRDAEAKSFAALRERNLGLGSKSDTLEAAPAAPPAPAVP
jgi:tetratricopeptide (TPR) repeat protein